MPTPQEALLESREQFFTAATLEDTPVGCIDERPSDLDTYLHAGGGAALNPAYNLRVVEEANNPGSSASKTFEGDVTNVTPKVVTSGVQPLVHSSETVEEGEIVRPTKDVDIDCGYAKLRQQLSAYIAAHPEEVLADAAEQEPELMSDSTNAAFGHSLIAAHGRMAQHASYFTNGRHVANAAMQQGASSMVVRGQHTGKHGIRNNKPGTTIRTTAASSANLPTYCHDSWAMKEIYDRLRDELPNDAAQMAVADLIDTVATMRVLGVEVIATRR